MNTEGLKVLLIDDTQIVLDHLQVLLSGIEQVSHIHAVQSAEEGLSLLPSMEPDIIILDINMPNMNGIDMLRRLSSGSFVRPVIVMLTNNTFAGYRDECIRLGADHFLDKSRDFSMIPSIIAGVRTARLIGT